MGIRENDISFLKINPQEGIVNEQSTFQELRSLLTFLF